MFLGGMVSGLRAMCSDQAVITESMVGGIFGVTICGGGWSPSFAPTVMPPGRTAEGEVVVGERLNAKKNVVNIFFVNFFRFRLFITCWNSAPLSLWRRYSQCYSASARHHLVAFDGVVVVQQMP